MYARLLVVFLLICLIVGSFYTGRIYERKDNAVTAIEIAKKNKKKTEEIQAARDDIATRFVESSTRSYKNEQALQKRLKELHRRKPTTVERLVEVNNDCGSDEPSNLAGRVQLVHEASNCSGLSDPHDSAFFIDKAYEIEIYTIEVMSQYCRVAQQLDSLIDVVDTEN